LVVLIDTSLDIDVQALGAREILQRKNKLSFFHNILLRKINLSISN
jgi:hypothetical protein